MPHELSREAKSGTLIPTERPLGPLGSWGGLRGPWAVGSNLELGGR
jgi:hypothetical protein